MTPPRLVRIGAIAGAVLVGALTAAQARLNGELGLLIEDGIVAGAISFTSGLVVVAVLVLAIPAGRRGAGRLIGGIRARRIPFWMLVAGAAGAFNVATQGLTIGIIGLSLFTVGFVAGQTISGLGLDRAGYGPAGVVAVTVPRVVGGALALLAVVLAFAGGVSVAAPLWMLVIPLLSGALVAWQQATNGRLRARIDSSLAATAMNFLAGSAVLIVAALIHVLFVGAPRPLPTNPWLYLGGTIGVAYIVLSAALVGFTGVLLLGLGTIVGQLVTAVVFDALWPAAASPGLGREILVVVVALASVVVAAVPWRRRRRRS